MGSYLAYGHGDGYAIWQLGRYFYHLIGWWSVPVTTVIAVAVAFVKVWIQDRFR